MRISKQEMFLRMAETVALRSTCLRKQVGCVVSDLDLTTVLAIGYNGSPRGWQNFCENPEAQGACGCIHAEANALLKAPYHTGPLVLFCTHSPCISCAKLIVNSAVQQVIYRTPFRDGTDFLDRSGILTMHVPTHATDPHSSWPARC
jgi:dCMP deaminase